MQLRKIGAVLVGLLSLLIMLVPSIVSLPGALLSIASMRSSPDGRGREAFYDALGTMVRTGAMYSSMALRRLVVYELLLNARRAARVGRRRPWQRPTPSRGGSRLDDPDGRLSEAADRELGD